MAQEYPDGQHHEPPRSPAWPYVERTVLHLHPYCACCGPTAEAKPALQVHHRLPFHYCIALGRPDMELDPRNLIVLCETEHGRPEPNHHLLIGHLGNFQSDNVHVGDDVVTFAGMGAAAIQSDRRWLARKATRLPLLKDMTDEQKADFRALMDAECPPQAMAA